MNCNDLTPKFNMTTKKCEACGISEVIDSTNITQCIKTNFVALCPYATPLYDQTKYSCVACPANTIYNSNTNSCESSLKSHQSLKIIPVSTREWENLLFYWIGLKMHYNSEEI